MKQKRGRGQDERNKIGDRQLASSKQNPDPSLVSDFALTFATQRTSSTIKTLGWTYNTRKKRKQRKRETMHQAQSTARTSEGAAT